MQTYKEDLNKGYTHPFVVSFSENFFVQVVIQLDQSHFAHCIESLSHLLARKDLFSVPVSPQPQSCGKEQTNFLTTFYGCHLMSNDRSLHCLKYGAFYLFHSKRISYKSIYTLEHMINLPLFSQNHSACCTSLISKSSHAIAETLAEK